MARSGVGYYAPALLLTLLATVGTVDVEAQFSNPKNLQVLPDTLEGQALLSVMRGIAGGLGVSCIYCHVGTDPSDMGSFQFNLDDKETKRVARGMLRMVNAINGEHLAAATAARDTPQPRVEVKCATCHRGATKPLFIQDIMADVIAEEGVEAAIAQYRELREAKFGGYSYDFRAGPLTSLGEALGGEGQVDDAVALLDLALEYYPDQPSIYWTYGNLLARAERTEEAIEKLERGSELAEGGFKRFFDNAAARLRDGG